MKTYRRDIDISLIYNRVNRYWEYNGAWNKYDNYNVIKQFKHDNPIEFKKRNRYDALANRGNPLCYHDKCNVVTPRKFIPTLKRLSSPVYELIIYKNRSIAIEYTRMRRKLCTDYYLPIYNLGKHD